MIAARWACVVAALGAAVYLLLDPATADHAAQEYRAGLGLGLWDNGWFAGHHTPAYSLLSPPLGALLGVRVAGAVTAVFAAGLFGLIAERAWGPRAGSVAAVWFAIGVLAQLVSGRLTFLLGAAFGLAALVALQRARPLIACALAVLTSVASPVAGLFLALAAIARGIAGRAPPHPPSRRRQPPRAARRGSPSPSRSPPSPPRRSLPSSSPRAARSRSSPRRSGPRSSRSGSSPSRFPPVSARCGSARRSTASRASRRSRSRRRSAATSPVSARWPQARCLPARCSRQARGPQAAAPRPRPAPAAPPEEDDGQRRRLRRNYGQCATAPPELRPAAWLRRKGPPRRAGGARAARRPRAAARLLAALSRGPRRRARERRPLDRRGLLRAARALPRRQAGNVPRRDPVHREPLGGGARRAARAARARLGAPARPPLRRAVLRRHADRRDATAPGSTSTRSRTSPCPTPPWTTPRVTRRSSSPTARPTCARSGAARTGASTRSSGPKPLVSGAARSIELEPDGFTLSAGRRGTALVRVRHTRWWSVTGGRACVERGPHGLTRVRVLRPGRVRVQARLGGSACRR